MTMERRCYTNKQHSRREYLEISGISASVADNGFESNVLKILEKIDVPIDHSFVEDCNCSPSKGAPEDVITKLNCRNVHL